MQKQDELRSTLLIVQKIMTRCMIMFEYNKKLLFIYDKYLFNKETATYEKSIIIKEKERESEIPKKKKEELEKIQNNTELENNEEKQKKAKLKISKITKNIVKIDNKIKEIEDKEYKTSSIISFLVIRGIFESNYNISIQFMKDINTEKKKDQYKDTTHRKFIYDIIKYIDIAIKNEDKKKLLENFVEDITNVKESLDSNIWTKKKN